MYVSPTFCERGETNQELVVVTLSSNGPNARRCCGPW
jgi:hypothetical protein